MNFVNRLFFKVFPKAFKIIRKKEDRAEKFRRGRSFVLRQMPVLSAVKDHSVRSAMTGSFFAAARAGKCPEMTVSAKEMQIMMIACHHGSATSVLMPVSEPRIRLSGTDKR